MSWRRWRVSFIAVVVTAVLSAGCAAGPNDTAVPPQSAPRGEWTQLPDGPLSARHEVTGAWVGGRFVLVGGWGSRPCPAGAGCMAPAEPALRDGASFDPETNRWRSVADAPVPVSTITDPVVIGDTMYLLTGNPHRNDSPVAMLAYSAKKDVWKKLPAPAKEGLTLVAVGEQIAAILYTAERKPAADYLFDPGRQTWRRLPPDPLGKTHSRTGLWWQGQLLLLASDMDLTSASPPTHVASLDITDNSWRRLPDLTIGGGYAVVVNGRVVHGYVGFDGTTGHGEFYPNGALVDPGQGTWHLLPGPPRGKGIGGHVLNVGSRTVIGGHLVDPVTERWTAIPKPPWPAEDTRDVVASDSSILVWGGTSEDKNVDDGWLLRP
ncbi:MAG TPA: hypothetical protein VF635_16050 [Propionibacteriaceae bacterium]